jgi:hypothetical protein
MSATKILVENQLNARSTAPAPSPSTSGPEWRIVFSAALALSVIGGSDVALLWYPLKFGNIDWEFATITAFFDGLPLATIGLSGMVAGATALRRRGVSRALAVFSVLMVMLLLALVGVYVLAVLSGVKTLNPAYEVMFVRAVLKTSVLAVTYLTLYTWLGWMSGRVNRIS